MNINQKYKIKQFQWFQMQTKVRQMIQQILVPIQKRIMQHSTNIAKVKQTQNNDSQQVQELKMIVTNDPKIFQYGIFKQLDQKFQIHEKKIQELTRLIGESNDFVQKKFQLIDIRMRQSNQSLLNFSALKQRVHKQMQIQNDNIHKIRQNLQKLIQKMGQQISKTNQKIVDNLMISQKMDNSLQQRISQLDLNLQINREAMQNNKKLIMDKNIQMENHDFKLERIFQKIKDLEFGQAINQKLEQYIKDMDISIKKCQFRLQAITPLVTMAQIQEALQYILPDKMRKKVIIFGYKKYSKLNKQILDKKYYQVKEKFSGIDLVQTMQKKNTRQITTMKRKKIISMGIDIDHLTFEARERYYQQVDMDELSQEQEDNQNNAKIDQAEILNLVSLYFNQFTTDVSQKVKNQLDDTKAYLYGMESELKKQMEMNQQKVKKCEEHCIKFHRDQILQMKSAQHQLNEGIKAKKEVLECLLRGQQVQRKFYNFCSLINHLQIQEEIDKQNISLMGIQQHKSSPQKGSQGIYHKNSIIDVEKNCFSCSGYPASVLSSFKMACLAYHPSQIKIDQKQYRREQILQFTTNILQTIKGSIQFGNLGEQNKGSRVNNINHLSANIIDHNYVAEGSFKTLQRFGSSRLEYSPMGKSKAQQTTTLNELTSKHTMKDPFVGEFQTHKKSSSIRLGKSLRRQNITSDQKPKTNNHIRSHSNSMSKDMITVTTNFLQLKKRHLSYLN